jgi:hypothetical protein
VSAWCSDLPAMAVAVLLVLLLVLLLSSLPS